MSLIIRPFQSTDLPAVLAVLSAALPADPISEHRFTRQALLDPNFRSEGALVARAGTEAAGFCLAIARHVPLENAPPDDDRGYVTLLAVAPEHRGRGIGSELLARAEAYLKSEGRRLSLISPYAPGYFTPGVDVHAYAEGLSFLTRRGYTEVSRPLAMEASLWLLPSPASVAGDGLCLECYRSELTLPLLEFVRCEFPGDWVRVVREAMGRILEGESPGRIIVVRRDERVVGFVHHDRERFGPIGVAAAARGQGIGRALTLRMLDSMREAGLRTAWFLWTDDRTAERLYSPCGFREVRRFAVLRKPL